MTEPTPDRDKVLAAAEMTPEALATHLATALSRPPDIAGTRQRTERNMKRYPKVLNYLRHREDPEGAN